MLNFEMLDIAAHALGKDNGTSCLQNLSMIVDEKDTIVIWKTILHITNM